MNKKASLPIFFTDIIIISLVSLFIFAGFVEFLWQLLLITFWCLLIFVTVFSLKNMYLEQKWNYKNYYKMLEATIISAAFIGIPFLLFTPLNTLTPILIIMNAAFIYVLMVISRLIFYIISKRKFVKNVLIVGAGQDGKLIAEEIQKRPELRLKVVGFLDDNMNTIEDEDANIPILGLTCDSEAVIKDNNVKIVIVAVKSQMDAYILTDLVKGFPLGVKIWRMPKFYEKITHKFFISKMTSNWLFYDFVRRKAVIYAYLKRLCDIIASIAIMALTSPLSIIAMIGIKLSDLGPIFYFQTRIGKFGKPFKMIKFRTMYQDEVTEGFDDDLNEINSDDKRIMPFCRILRKYHIDELPQMINVLRGEMSIVGPRPLREDVYYDNKDQIEYWECRNWVRPGWCGWQQINEVEPIAEERLRYDLYYMKHRNLIWELWIFIKYIFKIFFGKCE